MAQYLNYEVIPMRNRGVFVDKAFGSGKDRDSKRMSASGNDGRDC